MSCTPQGSAQLRWGKAVLVLGAGRAPGPEAAAAQLIPALPGLRQPRHILSLPAPGRPQDSRVTVPELSPATEPPRPQDNNLSTVMDRASPGGGQGWGKEEPSQMLQDQGVPAPCELQWEGLSEQSLGRGKGVPQFWERKAKMTG